MTAMAAPPLSPVFLRLTRAMVILTVVLAASAAVALMVGRQRIDLSDLLSDGFARTLFFRLRLPRVVLGLLIGASLSVSGAALQALFRNPLADPYTLGVSGGGALGASVAIAAGWSARLLGVPLVFVASFAGALAALFLVRTIARTGALLLPGALLLSGVVVNLICAAAILTIQYMADPNSALQMLRWMIGSLDVVGFSEIWRMLVLLVPAWLALLAFARPLHLLAMDQDTAATLGVNVRRCETAVHLLCAAMVGVSVSAGGTIGFVGLIVPHAVRLLFGEDLRIVLPGSLLLGGAVLVLADALGRTALGSGELPVGAVTGLLGGPGFLWLLRRRQQYSAM
jgi:iron complex transport system permease protein